jgi:hypothetical protein
MRFSIILKQPSAFLPMVMSLAALITVLVHIAMFGTAREPDEGAAAHIFQILMAAEVPIVAFFAIRWLPRLPTRTIQILALQVGAALVALAPVFFLNL